jgi:hypothetical protein
MFHHKEPDVNRYYRTASDKKKAGTLEFTGFSGL